MKIAILTTFYEWKKAYSLVSVVESQLLSLVKHGYETVLFVHDNFKDDAQVPKGVEIRKIIPRFELVDYHAGVSVHKDFEKQVREIEKALEENMRDIDIAITHDWMLQGWFLIYNIAMRKAKLDCKWLHWIHSAASPDNRRGDNLKYPLNGRFTTMPNSKLISLNHYDALRLAETYGGDLDDVRVVFNPLDPCSFYDFHPIARKLVDRYKLLDADVIDVYPVSSTRFAGKQPNKVIQIIAEMKKQGKSVRLVFCNAHANAETEKKAIQQLLEFAVDQGLTRKEVIFTSLEDKEWEQGIPRDAVRDLFLLSNVFIFPTLSEHGPLVLLEAAMSKCLLVLNDSFAPLRDFFGGDALYFKFGSLRETVNYPDKETEQKFYSDIAKIIIGELDRNKPLSSFIQLRQKFNTNYVFKHQLEPIFYEKYGRPKEN